MIHPASRFRLAAALLLPGLLACASQGIRVREYVLTPVSAAPVSSSPGGRELALAVGPVVMPPYLRRSEIVTRVGANEVRASDTQRWGEELGQGLARVVAENLAALVPALRVTAFLWRDAAAADYRVAIEVQRFEPMPDGSVALDARWQLLRKAEAAPVLVRDSSISEESGGSDAAAAVAAMSRAAGRLSQEIAQALQAGAGSIAAN